MQFLVHSFNTPLEQVIMAICGNRLLIWALFFLGKNRSSRTYKTHRPVAGRQPVIAATELREYSVCALLSKFLLYALTVISRKQEGDLSNRLATTPQSCVVLWSSG